MKYTVNASGIDVTIDAGIERGYSEDEKDCIRNFVYDFTHKLQVNNSLNDPGQVEAGKEMVDKLIACFTSCPIYVKKIPNQYGGRGPMYVNFPWLEVTTPKGIITIGWRRRVIHIDWEKSDIGLSAHTLFPNEEVTKWDRGIHAWGYPKAKEYLYILLG